MFKSKYSTVLTIILIILIIAIIIIATVLAIGAYKDYQEEKERDSIYTTLQENTNVDKPGKNNNTVDDEELLKPIDTNTSGPTNTTGGDGQTTRKPTKFYKEYPMIGYIKIEKTNVNYPVLLDVSPGALDTAVGVMYPSNPQLNTPGNVVIIGHNYRNGKFFANNEQLVIGDTIKITDLEGKTLTYTIYEISTIPETDTEYITRERGDNIEISLSTCTDDGEARLVILARVQ